MKEVLNAKDACEFLRVGKATLYRHVASGEIPSFRIGRALRFHKESLEKWIEASVTADTQAKKG